MAGVPVALHGRAGVGPGLRDVSGRAIAGVELTPELGFGLARVFCCAKQEPRDAHQVSHLQRVNSAAPFRSAGCTWRATGWRASLFLRPRNWPGTEFYTNSRVRVS